MLTFDYLVLLAGLLLSLLRFVENIYSFAGNLNKGFYSAPFDRVGVLRPDKYYCLLILKL